MAEVFRIFRRDLTEDGVCFLSEVLHTLLLKVVFLLCFLFQLLLSVLRERVSVFSSVRPQTQRSTYLSFPSAGIKCVPHHAWVPLLLIVCA